MATIINALILQYHIRQAEEISQEIEETIIRQNDHFNPLKDEFRHHKHHAENFKRGTVISAAATSLFLIVGCTLSFLRSYETLLLHLFSLSLCFLYMGH